MFWYDGQSGGVTPGPIPNPAVKSARVSVCTVVRKPTLFLSYLVAERPFFHTLIIWLMRRRHSILA